MEDKTIKNENRSPLGEDILDEVAGGLANLNKAKCSLCGAESPWGVDQMLDVWKAQHKLICPKKKTAGASTIPQLQPPK